MCGIAGIFDTKGDGAIDAALLSRMNDSQRHRGPDGDGIFIDDGIGLGHRRLAIIDLEGGAQPLFNEDKSVAVIFNGEIYNFQELARELTQKGHRFRTHCDTEVIVHGWEEWGEACLDRFRGMFAFAIWDRGKQILFLARDRLGIKPLYYTLRGDDFLLFSSELKALLVDPLVPRDVMYRPKTGFSVPISAWFRGPLRDRVRSAITGPVIADSGIFDEAYLAGLVSEHESGRSEHSPVLWSILMFEAFLRQVHEREGAA